MKKIIFWNLEKNVTGKSQKFVKWTKNSEVKLGCRIVIFTKQNQRIWE